MPRPTLKKLSQGDQQKLLLGLCEAIVTMKSLEDAANLLTDLLSPAEQEMLAKRLHIAKLLLDGKHYEDITSQLKVSKATIAKINAWLAESGEGFRLVCKRHQERNVKIPNTLLSDQPWNSMKRRYPVYHWPQLLLEDIVRSADNQQRRKLLSTLKILKKSKQKYAIFSEIEKLLRGTQTNTSSKPSR